MIRNILTAMQHNARSAAELRTRHAAFLRKAQARGTDVVAHEVAAPIAAHVNHGRWVFRCPACQAGVLTHPAWGLGCCFGCGAVYTRVMFPPDRSAIEQALVIRPALATRNWTPGESLETLRAENDAHGVRAS